jgi:hypothetical protein
VEIFSHTFPCYILKAVSVLKFHYKNQNRCFIIVSFRRNVRQVQSLKTMVTCYLGVLNFFMIWQ